jgi:chemotaxis response regulator CheB
MLDQYIAAIAGSAGSHHALLELFDHTPHDNVSYIILRHLPLTYRSQLRAILLRHSSLAIKEIRDGMVLRNDTIYIAPPGKYLSIEGNVFYFTERTELINRTADVFLKSLAENSGNRAMAIIMGGVLSDGSSGITKIHEAGGFVIAQDPSTSFYSEMPENAIRTGCVDEIATIREMPGIIRNHVEKSKQISALNK